jgi:cytochrome b
VPYLSEEVMQDSDIDSRQDHFYVWDAFVRIFHWTLVAAFATAYVIEDPLVVHVWAGYVELEKWKLRGYHGG